MGDCIMLSRRAARNAPPSIPVLVQNYPADVTVMQSSGYVYAEVQLLSGNPSECTYQWYWGDGTKIVGATSSELGINRYSAVGNTYVYCEVTNASGTVRSRTATITFVEAYLYKNGNVNTDITGGFDLVPAISNASYTMGAFENTDNLYVNLLATGQTMQGFCTTRNAIDLTHFETIRYTVVTSYTSYYYAPWTFCATNTKSGATDGAVAETSVNVPNRIEDSTRTYDVDISNVTGAYYVGFGNAVSDVSTYISVSAIQLL